MTKHQSVALGVGVFIIWMMIAINFMMDNTNSSTQMACVKRLAEAKYSEQFIRDACNLKDWNK